MAVPKSVLNDLSGARGRVQGGPATQNIFLRDASQVTSSVRNYQRSLSGGTSLYFPGDDLKYYMILTYSEYSRKFVDNFAYKTQFNKMGSIYLPLPVMGMSDSHNVDFEEESLGLGGPAATIAQAYPDAVSDAIEAVENTNIGNLTESFGKLVDAGGNFTQDVIDNVGGKTTELAKNLAAQQALKFIGGRKGRGAGQTAQSLLGVAPNKFMTILLRGPRYKRREFAWKLYPSDYKEADTINKIIVRLNNVMAVGLAAGGLLWDFPHVFYLQYVPNPKYLYKFKPMVLEELTTNYMQAGVPSFYAGNVVGENPPESVEIRARFVELEYWLRGQFNESNDGNVEGNHRKIDPAHLNYDEIRFFYDKQGNDLTDNE